MSDSLRIAETEKYAHVTYFFNGGEEEKFPGEERILIPSPRDVATYDLKPEMSAREVTEALVKYVRERDVGLVIANYANADMVGHTGNFEASVRAVEVIDECLGKVVDACNEQKRQSRDHGGPWQHRATDRLRYWHAAHGAYDQSRAGDSGR